MEEENSSKHHVITVWEIDNVPSYELFFRFARGFVHAALAILEEQCNSQRDYFNLMPAHFSLEHGLELFLKAAILLGDRSITPRILSSRKFGHNLGDLYEKYLELYPDEKFEMSHRIDELIDWRATINDPGGFASRYPFDNKGKMYGGPNRMVDLEFLMGIYREFYNDLNRLERIVKEVAGVQPFLIEQFRYRSTR